VRRPALTARRGLIAAVVVLGGLALALWLVPTGHYLLLPDKAQPVAPLIEIAGEGRQAAPADEEGGIYMVDILVRKATLLERFFPGINDGADLIPAERLNPQGVSEQQRRKANQLDMTRSQEIAAAVALEALDYEVDVQATGAEISLVLPDSPAAAAGLEVGDVIVEAQGTTVETLDDLRAALDTVSPGQIVEVSAQRSGGVEDYSIATIESEREPGDAVIGVIVQQAATIDLPIEIDIDAGSIGGPSAGLAFALDIVDELGSDVDQGRLIVATGELALDGSVQPVGGIEQKVIGAKQTGADIFVVPTGNAREAEQYADGLEIVPVATFDEALADLAWIPGQPRPEVEAA
jgi:PDZ domain-containing protein